MTPPTLYKPEGNGANMHFSRPNPSSIFPPSSILSSSCSSLLVPVASQYRGKTPEASGPLTMGCLLDLSKGHQEPELCDVLPRRNLLRPVLRSPNPSAACGRPR
ncbi:unnamed protein product [Protopolystoma xenopodis]|uniref:Uncharacterized protein n=1 Tax=Protopolystoma xenopodis TaxID=117903 RepID=A0A3S5BLN4_9PLAT|nr:unnamed protein product [Protopolystoma xenopodis]